MYICRLFTDPLEMRRPDTPNEFGVFECIVALDEVEITESGDAQAYVNRYIATCLANCVQQTGVPMHFWVAEFSTAAQQRLSFPKEVRWK